MSAGRAGPPRGRPTTIPTTLAASVTENVAEYQARPSRSALTVGMIVVTAIASKANRKIRLTMPIVAQRYAGARSGVVGGEAAVVTGPRYEFNRGSAQVSEPLWKPGSGPPAMSVVTPSVVGMDDDLTDLDAAGLLAASSEAVRARRLAEVRDLKVLVQWAAVHSGEPAHPRDRLMELAGEGAPKVQEFCLGEIALARGTGATATMNALIDGLDLVYRMPRTWAVLETGEAEVHIARRVAKLSRHLPAAVMPVVDRAVARIIALESGGRVLEVAEAKIIEADPALHEARVEAEKRRRYVTRRGPTSSGCARSSLAARPATWCGSRPWWPGSRRSSRRCTPTPLLTSFARSRSAGSPDLPSCSRCCWSTATSRKRSTWALRRHRDPGACDQPRHGLPR